MLTLELGSRARVLACRGNGALTGLIDAAAAVPLGTWDAVKVTAQGSVAVVKEAAGEVAQKLQDTSRGAAAAVADSPAGKTVEQAKEKWARVTKDMPSVCCLVHHPNRMANFAAS